MSYSSQVTSHLPIQKGAIFSLCWGDSSSPRLASPAGLPITNSPPGIGTMSNETSVPISAWVYFFISAGTLASAAGLGTGATAVAAGASADSTLPVVPQSQAIAARTSPAPATPTCANLPWRPTLLIDQLLASKGKAPMFTCCWLTAAALVLGHPTDRFPERFEFTQIQMGMPFRIVLYAPDADSANAAARAAYARIRQLNSIMSDYDDES